MLTLSVDTKLETADGSPMGEVDRFIVNPSRKEVTHVVVRRGALFTDERVVPIETLTEENGAVRLRAGVDPADLPRFERGHYAEMDPVTRSGFAPQSPRALVWAYPIPSVAGFPAYPWIQTPDEAVVEKNVPDGEVLVSEGAPVVSAQGTEIGSISEVGVDERGFLSHIEVDPGFFRSKRTIPSHWIDSIETGRVLLAVDDETLDEFGKL